MEVGVWPMKIRVGRKYLWWNDSHFFQPLGRKRSEAFLNCGCCIKAREKSFILPCDTCPKGELLSFCLCVCTFSSLSFPISLACSLTCHSVSASCSASRPSVSTSIPTISVSHFSRFCLLTFPLSAEQIPLQLPKLCQKALLLFIYVFYCFSATSSLNRESVGW